MTTTYSSQMQREIEKRKRRLHLAEELLNETNPDFEIERFLGSYCNTKARFVLKVRKSGEESAVLKIGESGYPDHISREIRVLEEMKSSGYVPVLYDEGTCQGHRYLVKEFVEGETMDGRYHLMTLEMKSELAETVREFHSQGIYDLDLSPQNVILTPDRRLRLFDFGLCLFSMHPNTMMDYGDLKDLWGIPRTN
ncbi:MAG: hypothetical protein Q8P81_03970 [Nanoarchaeota archaeon]|nr:hypothetical protein [Nanoarchaeota archaeon]